MNINEKNYEEFLIRHIENDLSDSDREALFLFLEKHPEYRRELELFEQTLMIPDETVSFGNTAVLKRTATRFYLNNWLILTGMAAAILVLVYFKFLNPGMSVVQSVGEKQTQVSNRSAQPVAVNNINKVPAGNSNLQKSNRPVNKAAIPFLAKEKNLTAAQIQNSDSIQQTAAISSPLKNNQEPLQIVKNADQGKSFSLNQQSIPVIAMNAENVSSGKMQLNTMNEIIPAAYVDRKREILVSKVPDVYYSPVASVTNQQSQQGNPFKDLASLFKAAVDHTPISHTSFYQHSSVGKLLTTQVVYEHH